MRPREQPCGTEAAYQWHRKHGEPACAPCKAAHSTNVMENNWRRGLTRGGKPWVGSRPYYTQTRAA